MSDDRQIRFENVPLSMRLRLDGHHGWLDGDDYTRCPKCLSTDVEVAYRPEVEEGDLWPDPVSGELVQPDPGPERLSCECERCGHGWRQPPADVYFYGTDGGSDDA